MNTNAGNSLKKPHTNPPSKVSLMIQPTVDLGVDVECSNTAAVHVIPEVQTGARNVDRHGLAQDACSVVSSLPGRFRVEVVT